MLWALDGYRALRKHEEETKASGSSVDSEGRVSFFAISALPSRSDWIQNRTKKTVSTRYASHVRFGTGMPSGKELCSSGWPGLAWPDGIGHTRLTWKVASMTRPITHSGCSFRLFRSLHNVLPSSWRTFLRRRPRSRWRCLVGNDCVDAHGTHIRHYGCWSTRWILMPGTKEITNCAVQTAQRGKRPRRAP